MILVACLESSTSLSSASLKNGGIESTLSGGIQRDVMAPNDKQAQFLKKIENILGKNILTEQRGGVSDANHMASGGVITMDGFGPFGDGNHTINERAEKKSFVDRIELSSQILSAFMRGNF